MREDVRRSDDFSWALLPPNLLRHGSVKESDFGRDATLVCKIAHLARLNPKDAMPDIFEIAEQRAVVRANVDGEILWFHRQHGLRLGIKFGEIVPKDLRRAARIRILRRKKNFFVHDESQLNQRAPRALQPKRGISRLLLRERIDGSHLIYGRQITQKQNP